jgi:DNA-binding transcriptional ArsR family regulator
MLIYKCFPKNGIMSIKEVENKALFRKIKIISNSKRFKILELTQEKKLSITKLSSSLNLTYTKCSDYVKILENEKLVSKSKDGKNVLVRSNVKISKGNVIF